MSAYSSHLISCTDCTVAISTSLLCATISCFLTLIGFKLSFCWTVPSFLPYFNELQLISVFSISEICALLCFSLCCLWLNYILLLFFCQYIFKIFLIFYIYFPLLLFYSVITLFCFKLYIHFVQYKKFNSVVTAIKILFFVKSLAKHRKLI